jgi:hypothetical protein
MASAGDGRKMTSFVLMLQDTAAATTTRKAMTTAVPGR